jgi:hypothetical protein
MMFIRWLNALFLQRWFCYASRWRNLRYHFRNADWDRLHVLEAQRSGRRRLPWLALLAASWRHGASFEDYYLLRFFDLNRNQRRNYLTLSLFYELERQQNDLNKAQILRDKALFTGHFKDLLGREVWTWTELLELDPDGKPPPRLVIKSRFGVQGRDIYFPETQFPTWSAVIEYMQAALASPKNYLCESWLQQHPDLERLNPGTVNTLRVVTYLRGAEVQIWGVILRIGCGNGPDNWACGGLGAWVDEDGQIRRKAVLKDPFAAPQATHPVSGRPIVGVRVPFFDSVCDLARESALRLPEVRTVGWDIVVKTDGVCLLEGNDRWSCALLQNALGKGCREWADVVCDMYKVYE